MLRRRRRGSSPTAQPPAADFTENSLDRCFCPDYRSSQPYFAMLIVHVHVHLKPDCIDAFKAASLANAHLSVREPGIARFDVVQQVDDSSRFVFVEVYRTPAATAAHKETTHYQVWRDTVASMMAGPRTSVKFANVFPADSGW